MATPHKVTGHVMASHLDRIDEGATDIRAMCLQALADPSADPFAWVQLAGRVLQAVEEQIAPGLDDARRVAQGKSR